MGGTVRFRLARTVRLLFGEGLVICTAVCDERHSVLKCTEVFCVVYAAPP